MKKIYLIVVMSLLMFIVGCNGSSVVSMTKKMKTKPYSVSLLFSKATAGELRNTYEMQDNSTTELLSSLIHSFDEDDQANLKKSLYSSIQKSKPFEKMTFLNKKEEVASVNADYQVFMIFAGSSVSGGNVPKASIGLAVVIKDTKQNRYVFKKVFLNKGSSMMSLGSAKNEAIKKTVMNVLLSLNTI